MTDKFKLKTIFSNSNIEINDSHEEALAVFSKYYKNKQIPILVNYDSHSDIYVNTKMTKLSHSDWVNHCFVDFNVKEYYWIIPNYIMQNPAYRKAYERPCYIETNKPFQSFEQDGFDFDKVNIRDFFINIKTKEFLSGEKVKHINNKCKKFNIDISIKESEEYKKVTLYVLSLKNIGVLKNKTVALSVDADAFCNSGFDSFENINNNNINREELIKEFDLFINALYLNGIKPQCTSLSTSFNYFPKKYSDEINDFYKNIKSVIS